MISSFSFPHEFTIEIITTIITPICAYAQGCVGMYMSEYSLYILKKLHLQYL